MMGSGSGSRETNKAGEEEEESRLRKTERYLKELDGIENKKEPDKVQEVVEATGEVWMTEEESSEPLIWKKLSEKLICLKRNFFLVIQSPKSNV